MRYTEITLLKHGAGRDWGMVIDPVKGIGPDKAAYTVDGIKIHFDGENTAKVYLPESHPFFNILVLRKKFYSAPQYWSIRNLIEETLYKILKPLENNFPVT